MMLRKMKKKIEEEDAEEDEEERDAEENDEEDAEEEEDSEEDEEEEEVEEIEVNGEKYYGNEKCEGSIYEYLEDGEVGDEVGHYVNNEPIIF